MTMVPSQEIACTIAFYDRWAMEAEAMTSIPSNSCDHICNFCPPPPWGGGGGGNIAIGVWDLNVSLEAEGLLPDRVYFLHAPSLQYDQGQVLTPNISLLFTPLVVV